VNKKTVQRDKAESNADTRIIFKTTQIFSRGKTGNLWKSKSKKLFPKRIALESCK